MATRMMKLGVLAALAAALTVSCAREGEHVAAEAKKDAGAAAAEVKEKEARDAAIEAYIYAYPLVTMEYTRRISTNTEKPEGSKAPMGQFARLREYPAVDDHTVTAPNADTLYTVVWLDLSKEPWIVSIPDMKDRFFLFPMLDGWTNVFQVPGKRTTGTKAQKYALTGPGWSGTLPADVMEYKSPTAMVWVLGRIYCTGTPEDYKAVHALQDQVNALDGAAFFKLFAELLKANPPAADDAPMVATLAKLGIVPGQDFDAAKLDPAVAKGIAASPKPAQDKIMAWMKEGIVAGDMKLEHGWLFTTKTGLYGTAYRQRALVTAIGLGANRPQDAVYPTSEGPDAIKKYSGEHKYVMHFEKGQMPPVQGFWSLTMYDENYFFVPNDLHRQTLSQRNKLKANADGSIDMYIQHDSPGKEKEANWLPAPPGRFILMMRLYWPTEKPPSLLDGSWKIPEVKEAS